MPPANTPTESPSAQREAAPAQERPPHHHPQTPPHQRPLTPLSYLSSPAPDLASTLYATSQAADEADEANVSFLRRSVDSLQRAGGQQQQQQRRTHVDAYRDPRRRSQHQADAGQQSSGDTPEDITRRQRLQRVLAGLNRIHEPRAASSNVAAYSNQTPSPNRQTLYDWAPSYDDSNENAQENDLDTILNELRQEQPDTHPDILRVLGQSQLDEHRHQQRQQQRELADAVAAERRNRARDRERRSRDSEWSSLRNRAVLQRLRQEGAGSPSATERMLRYVMERERSGLSEEEDRARGSGWLRDGTVEDERASGATVDEGWALLPSTTTDLRDRERRERVDAFRRGYLAENVPPRLPRIATPPVHASQAAINASFTFLESALKYLSELRDCTRYEDALSTAMDHGLATKEFFADKHDDFVMDLDDVQPLPYTSWLQSGMIFDGHQHATGASTSVTQQDLSAARSRVEQINPNYHTTYISASGFDHPPSSTQRRYDHPPGSTLVARFEGYRPRAWLNHPSPSTSLLGTSSLQDKSQHDQWPVRVILHAIDAEKMTLQATMEAYDVPQHSGPGILSSTGTAETAKAGNKSAPITTYLEGHIIDFRTHSLLTPNGPDDKRIGARRGPHMTTGNNMSAYTHLNQDIAFPSASVAADAENWLKLPPFSDLPPSSPDSGTKADSLARLLVSAAGLAKLNSEYILMRWKERSFVHTKNSTCTSSPAERMGDQDRGHGLTIGGFYYVSLRRSDGRVEGLYFDPGSTPYQCIKLEGGTAGGPSGGMGTWGFR